VNRSLLQFFCISISNDFPSILNDVEEQLHHRYCIVPMDLIILDWAKLPCKG